MRHMTINKGNVAMKQALALICTISALCVIGAVKKAPVKKLRFSEVELRTLATSALAVKNASALHSVAMVTTNNAERKQEYLKAAAACLIACDKKDIYAKHVKGKLLNAAEFEGDLKGDCQQCSGKGSKGRRCYVCNGSGRCASCKGTGQLVKMGFDRSNGTKTCHKCNGDGICNKCRGEGSFNEKCLICSGTGKAFSKEIAERVFRDSCNAIADGMAAEVKAKAEAERLERERKEAAARAKVESEKRERMRIEAEARAKVEAAERERNRKAEEARAKVEAEERERKRKAEEAKEKAEAERLERERKAEEAREKAEAERLKREREEYQRRQNALRVAMESLGLVDIRGKWMTPGSVRNVRYIVFQIYEPGHALCRDDDGRVFCLLYSADTNRDLAEGDILVNDLYRCGTYSYLAVNNAPRTVAKFAIDLPVAQEEINKRKEQQGPRE